MQIDLAVLPGDGIGPEVTAEAINVLKSVGKKFGHRVILRYGLVGGVAIDETGVALPDDTMNLCKKCKAILLGAVGGPKWDDPKVIIHPEDGLLALRKGLGLFANLRPIKVFPTLVNSTNIKQDIIKGVDFLFVRELTGGLYFARPKKLWHTSRGRRATDSMTYSEQEIERIVRVGFELARKRRKKLISVDKANVLQSSRLWRQVARELSTEYQDVELEHMLVDACAMRIIQNPKYFDVLVTENMFGDILTDEASMLAGSMGMLPSASLAGIPRAGISIYGLYEPIHGSAPRRAGLNIANPIAIILSSAMMLRYSFGLDIEAQSIEIAVGSVLQEGYRTYDIMGKGKKKIGNTFIGRRLANNPS
ncbi:3-isopropylmalate dehydrogenase, partial [Chloroflexota bacterium]